MKEAKNKHTDPFYSPAIQPVHPTAPRSINQTYSIIWHNALHLNTAQTYVSYMSCIQKKIVRAPCDVLSSRALCFSLKRFILILLLLAWILPLRSRQRFWCSKCHAIHTQIIDDGGVCGGQRGMESPEKYTEQGILDRLRHIPRT